jgi:hypothetical protein
MYYLDAAMRLVGVELHVLTILLIDCRVITISTMKLASLTHTLWTLTPKSAIVTSLCQQRCSRRSTGKCLPLASHKSLTSRRFVFAGLEHLMEHLLISNARYVRMANGFGIRKIMRNTLALQQSVRTIGDDQQHVEFERAKSYYALFFLTPQVHFLLCLCMTNCL